MGPFDRVQTPIRYAINPLVHGYDQAFWVALTGIPTAPSNAIILNDAEIASKKTYLYGNFGYSVIIPGVPTSGDNRAWGVAFRRNVKNAAYFQILDDEFSCITIDFQGNQKKTVLAWDAGYLAETYFEVAFGPTSTDGAGNTIGISTFKINGVEVASHYTNLVTVPCGLMAANLGSDNLSITSVVVESEYEYLTAENVSLVGSTITSAAPTKVNEITNYNSASDIEYYGNVACDATVGGTVVLPQNDLRMLAQCVNTGAFTIFFGHTAVDATFNPVPKNEPFTWDSKRGMKVFSPDGTCNISFCDYSKT